MPHFLKANGSRRYLSISEAKQGSEPTAKPRVALCVCLCAGSEGEAKCDSSGYLATEVSQSHILLLTLGFGNLLHKHNERFLKENECIHPLFVQNSIQRIIAFHSSLASQSTAQTIKYGIKDVSGENQSYYRSTEVEGFKELNLSYTTISFYVRSIIS